MGVGGGVRVGGVVQHQFLGKGFLHRGKYLGM